MIHKQWYVLWNDEIKYNYSFKLPSDIIVSNLMKLISDFKILNSYLYCHSGKGTKRLTTSENERNGLPCFGKTRKKASSGIYFTACECHG